MDNEYSVACMDEAELKKELQARLTGWDLKIIEAGVALLSLTQRGAITKVPKGYEKDDIYPWRYNRALSYLRKPLVRIERNGGATYYWGFRHVYATYKHLYYLLFTGRLKSKDGGLLSKYMAKINAEKGDRYRNLAAKWLTENTSLQVIPHEVAISPNGHLKADKNFGDIDILAIDHDKKIIYSIECKNTVSARIIHEMKTELDKYIGKDGKSGMIEKHVERDRWIKVHIDQLRLYVNEPGEYKVESLVLSYEDIPIAYLAKHKLPLPIFSYQQLIRTGAPFKP